MYSHQTIIFLTLFTTISTNRKFPNDFLFGIATSAYQIEGGHDRRGETIFDYHQKLNPSMVLDQSDAKITCDSYHQYQKDLDILNELGVDFYRFSIAWTRILPMGYSNKISPDGLKYYNALIDGLLERNIQPMVTMYHYDLPQVMQELGGWANPLVADFFQDYAQILFDNFGDRVKLWITFNVMLIQCANDIWPPKLNQTGIGEYLCVKNQILAHAKTYKLYQEKYKTQKGKIGITIDGRWYEPHENEVEAAQRAREFLIGLIAHPIFGNGNFPETVRERVRKFSNEEGFLRSRLPEFSPSEAQLVEGSADFLGLNIYTTFLVEEASNWTHPSFSFEKDIGVRLFQDSTWDGASSDWLKVVPWGFRNVLKWVKTQYGNPPIFITENGFSDNSTLEDLGRINYHKLYLSALLDAIQLDGVDVRGYTAWSLLDNFEWINGYTEKFGLYYVNFSHPERKRTAKRSAIWYKNFLKARTLHDVRNEL